MNTLKLDLRDSVIRIRSAGGTPMRTHLAFERDKETVGLDVHSDALLNTLFFLTSLSADMLNPPFTKSRLTGAILSPTSNRELHFKYVVEGTDETGFSSDVSLSVLSRHSVAFETRVPEIAVLLALVTSSVANASVCRE